MMLNLNEPALAWRNYLFANHAGHENAGDHFKTRVSLIDDAKEQWMEELLKQEPNEDLIKECKEEIAFQKEQLAPILQEYVEYCKYRHIETGTVEEMLEDICQHGSNDITFRIFEDWEDIAEAAGKLWETLWDKSDEGISCSMDIFYESFMDKFQNEKARKIFLSQTRGSR